MGEVAGRRVLGSYIPPQAYAPRTRAALEGLGYRVVPALTQGRFGEAAFHADVRIVDPRHLDRLPDDRRTPIIGVRGPENERVADPRLLGCVARPAEISALYPLLQRALEPHPRRAARAPVSIPARCTRADRRWSVEVVSLSETGCLLRGAPELETGTEFNLLFPLPLGRMISARARVQCLTGSSAGVSFHAPSDTAREAIDDFVQRRLATL